MPCSAFGVIVLNTAAADAGLTGYATLPNTLCDFAEFAMRLCKGQIRAEALLSYSLWLCCCFASGFAHKLRPQPPLTGRIVEISGG